MLFLLLLFSPLQGFEFEATCLLQYCGSSSCDAWSLPITSLQKMKEQAPTASRAREGESEVVVAATRKEVINPVRLNVETKGDINN